jgi:hypothetical protein
LYPGDAIQVVRRGSPGFGEFDQLAVDGGTGHVASDVAVSVNAYQRGSHTRKMRARTQAKYEFGKLAICPPCKSEQMYTKPNFRHNHHHVCLDLSPGA